MNHLDEPRRVQVTYSSGVLWRKSPVFDDKITDIGHLVVGAELVGTLCQGDVQYQLRLHLETNRIDCNYNNNTINNININIRAGPRLEKLKLRKSTVSISKARENKASIKSSMHTSQ